MIHKNTSKRARFFISRYMQLDKNSDLTLDHWAITCSFLNPTLTPNRQLKITFLRQNILFHFFQASYNLGRLEEALT